MKPAPLLLPSTFLLFLATAYPILLVGCGIKPQLPGDSRPTPTTVSFETAQLALIPNSATVSTAGQIAFGYPFSGPWPITWTVNGIVGGNDAIGTVTVSGIYTAPLLPPPQPVIIAAALPDASQNPQVMSAAATITIVNPLPTIDNISPSTISIGNLPTQVKISGSGFNPASQVTIGGQFVPATFVTTESLTATVPGALVPTGALLSAIVINPAPSGGISSSGIITILNPAPVVNQISPQSINAGVPDLKVALTGSGFQTGSHVSLNGQVLASTLSDPSTLSVVVPSSNLAMGGTLSFTVSNNSPGGGTSNSPSLTVLNPAPLLASLLPAFLFAGTGPTTLTISGSGFVPTSLAVLNGQILSTSLISNDQLQLTIPNSLVTNPGVLALSVSNPEPGGGLTGVQNITVLPNGQVTPTNNPQVASYSIAVPANSKVEIDFGEQDYSLKTAALVAPNGGGQLRLLVAGMKANTRYYMKALVLLADGTQISDSQHEFDPGSLPPDELPTLTVTRTGLGVEAPGVQLFDNFDFAQHRITLFVTDRDGNIIWTYPQSAVDGGYQPAQLLDNGDIIVNTTTEIREFNLAGEVTKDISLAMINTALATAGYSVQINVLHHDLLQLANGHFILLGNTYKDITLSGSNTITTLLGDVLIDIDPNFNVVWLWNSFDHLDVNRRSLDPGGFTAPNDWTHSNAVVYLPQDGNLLLSMRHQSWILKIDYENGTGSGDVLWKLGWQGDFTGLNEPIDWFYFQHYANVLSDDGRTIRMAIFDNGDNRILDDQGNICGTVGQPTCYSRALILDLDEQAKTAQIEFQHDLGLFSNWGGSAQVNQNGDFFAGVTATSTGGRAEEISTGNMGQLIWQIDVNGQNAYRTLRLPSLYPGVQWP